jgi:putative Ca2+/H+ antiporter (TMEM165/GDT1 family)
MLACGPGTRGAVRRRGRAERDLRLGGGYCPAGVWLWRGGDDGSRMNLAVLGTVFGVVFVAELPDKTALASLVLGTRYRPGYVFAGASAAFALHVVLAVSAGSLLFLLPHRVMQAAVGVLFVAGAVLMLRRQEDDAPPGNSDSGPNRADDELPGDGVPVRDESRGGVVTLTRPVQSAVRPGFWTVAWRSFAVLLVAEFGDLTQLVTANLAARDHDPLAVGAGAVLGLWAVGALAIVAGRQLLRVVPFRWITRAAAMVMAGLAVASLIAATTG